MHLGTDIFGYKLGSSSISWKQGREGPKYATWSQDDLDTNRFRSSGVLFWEVFVQVLEGIV